MHTCIQMESEPFLSDSLFHLNSFELVKEDYTVQIAIGFVFVFVFVGV